MTFIKRRENLFPTVNNIFDQFFADDFKTRRFTQPTWFRTATRQTPAVNIRETEERFELELAAPGMKKEDFHIELKDNVLTIGADFQKEDEQKDEGYTRREFNYGSFKRSFTLQEEAINMDKIEAKYDAGILKVMVPKRTEEEKQELKRVITIQ